MDSPGLSRALNLLLPSLRSVLKAWAEAQVVAKFIETGPSHPAPFYPVPCSSCSCFYPFPLLLSLPLQYSSCFCCASSLTCSLLGQNPATSSVNHRAISRAGQARGPKQAGPSLGMARGAALSERVRSRTQRSFTPMRRGCTILFFRDDSLISMIATGDLAGVTS